MRLSIATFTAPVVSLIIAGCVYHPGSFRDRTGDWPAARAVTACLDLALARHDRSDVAGAVIAYNVGNRCDHRVVVDLASIRAVGRDSHGRETALVAYDPRGELRPIALAALWSGRAEIAYQAAEHTLASVCVDIGAIDRDRAGSARWQCFARETP